MNFKLAPIDFAVIALIFIAVIVAVNFLLIKNTVEIDSETGLEVVKPHLLKLPTTTTV